MHKVWNKISYMSIKSGICRFLHENICCGHTLEAPLRGVSDNPTHISWIIRKKMYTHYSCVIREISVYNTEKNEDYFGFRFCSKKDDRHNKKNEKKNPEF